MTSPPSCLLVDTNLLVLLVVGTVNRGAISSYKRTSKYTAQDYDLLLRLVDPYPELLTLAHIAAEVSNLTDMPGLDRERARRVLKELLHAEMVQEPVLPSARASEHPVYDRLGIVDAAIATLASERKCAVLTDDMDLYLALSSVGIPVDNFSHLRAQSFGA